MASTTGPTHVQATTVRQPLTVRRAMGAVVVGTSVGVLLNSLGAMGFVEPPFDWLLCIGCGLLASAPLLPWRRRGRQQQSQAEALTRLRRLVARLVEGDRTLALNDLVIDRQDEIGLLSLHIRELAVETIASRRQTRLLQRRMDDTIQRETRKATAHLERAAATDPLTGLGNRRALEQHIEDLLTLRGSEGMPLTVMALDLDLFKEVNDTLGHEVGDACLAFLADLLRSGLRREDRAIRVGGDEFVVLMPGQSIEQAQAAAERVVSLYAQMPWPYAGHRRPTVSVGLCADYLRASLDVSELLRRADAALYQSKQAGRDAVSCFGV